MRIRFPSGVAIVLSLALLLALHPAAAQEPEPSAEELSLALAAKVLCSAVFVSGREAEEALENSVLRILPGSEALLEMEMEVDHEQKLVRTWQGSTPVRTAKFYGDQGCVIHPRGKEGVLFQPVKLETTLPDAATQPWPMGDLLPNQPLPPEIDEAKLAEAVEAAFANPEGLTAVLVVVHQGRIIAERYAQGADKDTQLESWSMGKSLTATLVGVLVQEGHFGLFDPAPVREWQKPSDRRAGIRVADLMRMSSGLRFTSLGDPPEYEHAHPDHFYIYSGAIDAFAYSISRPLEFAPNTVGRYRNCDPLTLGYIIQQTVGGKGEEYLSFPQRALFDRIGIRRQVLEPDPYGNFLLTGYDYGTGRNWARLGLLYLQDGLWQGERILPRGWAEFVGTPAPAWKEPEYGGLFWVNGTGEWNLPKDSYSMAGYGGQRVLVVPSHELVVVRMGHSKGNRAGMQDLNNALAKLMEAIPPKQ